VKAQAIWYLVFCRVPAYARGYMINAQSSFEAVKMCIVSSLCRWKRVLQTSSGPQYFQTFLFLVIKYIIFKDLLSA